MLDLLGMESREELIGRSIFDVIHPEDQEQARRELAAVTDRKEPAGPTSMRLQPPDGRVRYIRVSTAIASFLGEDIGQAVAIDVTDREERERQLEVLDKWLRHNIRNETTVILGLADMIEKGLVDDPEATAGRTKERAEHLVEQADHEREIIELLATSSRSERTSVDVSSAVDRQVERVQATRPDATIAVSAEERFTAHALPEIETAIAELVENAIVHNDAASPSVEVEIGCDDDRRGFVTVPDDGPGIPKVERDSLLLDQETDQINHGSGLGLVLVHWVVRLSGGDVEFAEREPRGSVVTITLDRTGSPG